MKQPIKTQAMAAIPLFVVGLALGPTPAGAVSTLVWRVHTQEQFKAGEPKDLSLTPTGEVILSPPLELLASVDEPYVWCLARDRRGNLYAGTGSGGRVLKVSKDKTSLHFDAPGAEIYAMTVGPRGTLYVGSSPEGIVYRVDPDGRSSQFFKSEERYIWSMVFDDRGTLYVGCGEKGKIYSVNPDGEGNLLYDSEERHVLSLVWDRGTLYAGTEGKGLIYKITSSGQAVGIFDPPEGEVRSIALHPSGDLYVSAIGGSELPKEGKKEKKPAASTKSGSDNGLGSAIYRVSPEGIFTKVWSSPSYKVLALGIEAENLLAGTGDEGRFYVIDPTEGATDLFQCQESQILSLLQVEEEIYLGTGNMGRIYKVGRGYRKEGELVSKVQDTGTLSRWGRISWVGDTPSGTRISFQTRSGNTEEVDRTWSGWSSEYSTGDRIGSPPARFVQWRAVLSTSDRRASPVLSSIQVAYLPRNLPPTITSFSVLPPGVGAGGSNLLKSKALSQERKKVLEEMGLSLPDKVYELERGSRSAWWEAEDPNGDSLVYTLYFKGEEEREWKALKEDLTTTDHTFDSFSLPDGYYRLKVVASDLPENPEETALSADKVSESFLVDNSPPQVDSPGVDPRGGEVKLKAQDSLSPLRACQYSVDGGDWRSVFPVDGLFDSRAESFRFQVRDLSPGEHTIAIKVMDAHSNVGSSKRVFYKR